MRKTFSNYVLSPAGLFLVAAVGMAIFSFFVDKQSTFDLAVNNTYFVISNVHFFRGLALLFILGCGVYIWLDWILWKRSLGWLHVLITVAMLPLIGVSVRFLDVYTVLHYGDMGAFGLRNVEVEQARTLLMIFLLGQVLFLVNLVGGMLARRNIKKRRAEARQENE